MDSQAWQEFVAAVWANETLLLVLGLCSLFSFLASLVVIPFLIVRIPVDYFAEVKRCPTPWAHRHFIIRWTILILKNVVGLFFMLLGLAMLVLPGQGLLTLLIGLLLLNFPGKYRLERWLIHRPAVNRAVSWLRHRAGREPLEF